VVLVDERAAPEFENHEGDDLVAEEELAGGKVFSRGRLNFLGLK
jgi:hypothetical protein